MKTGGRVDNLKNSRGGGPLVYDAHALFNDLADLVNTFVDARKSNDGLETTLRDVKAVVVLLKDRVDEKFYDAKYYHQNNTQPTTETWPKTPPKNQIH